MNGPGRRGVEWLARALAGALVCCGCGAAQPPLIRVPAPAPGAALPVPASGTVPSSLLAIVVEVELDAIRAQVEAALPRAQNQDWQPATREGASPRVELRIFVERDPVQIGFAKGVLRSEIPLRYWADVRGAVKSPLPWHKNRWFDLERASWGTREAPQRITLIVHTRAQVTPAGDLRVESSLEPLTPGPAPDGSFCVKAGIRLCVSKQTFAGEVRSAFERRVEPELRAAVAALDRRLEQEADLRPRLQHAWQALHCPRALHRAGAAACAPPPGELGTWLQLAPERLIASELTRRGRRLRLLVALEGKLELVRGAAPPIATRPLPPIELRKPKANFALQLEVALSYDLLSTQLATTLPSGELSLGGHGKAKLSGARIAGASAGGTGGLLLLELRLAGDVDAVLYAHAELQPARGRLALARLRYTPESERALARALPELDRAAFGRALEGVLVIPLEPAADLFESVISAAIETGDPRVAVSTQVSRIALSELRLGGDGLLALLALDGRTRITIAP